MVSVVMAVFNGAEYIRESLHSILNQTFQDFELIIVDDASTDNTVNVIKEYKDDRIVLICNDENMKLPKSLNKGIKFARGKYIIRMDADDICMPNRFAKQVSFMEKHPDIAASSGNYYTIDDRGKIKRKFGLKIRSWRLTGKMLNRYVLIPSPLVHPAAIIRKKIFDEGILYNEDYTSAQDYELWLNIHRFYKLGNIPDVILKYRIHEKSISVSKRKKQLLNAYKIFQKYSAKKISFDDFKNIMRFEYTYNPIHSAKMFYFVFGYIDIVFIKSMILYSLKWWMHKM